MTWVICIAPLLGIGIAGMVAAGPARAAGEGSPWTLSVDKPQRTCQLSLRFNAAGAAGELAVPAGCRRAIPAIRQATSWSIVDAGQIHFNDANGGSLLAFDRQADGGWHVLDAEGRDLRLAPAAAGASPLDGIAATASEAAAVALATTPSETSAGEGAGIKLPAAARPPKGVAASAAKELAGRYAVLRGDRDTGCMVTLDADTRSAKGGYRARLAPACRDQGIIIFDPLGWQPKGSDLVLTARKGHSISLEKDQNGIWVKMPNDAKALGLKHL